MIIFNNIMKNINIELNDISPSRRLSALKSIIAEENATGEKPVFNPADANNHIHTIYSFSPYSPTLAAYKAYVFKTMGIMDHDTLSGARNLFP